MTKLWNKNTGKQKLNKLIENYTVGTDYILDNTLMPYDILASKAHAKSLQKIGILNKEELQKILKQLTRLEKEWRKGKVKIRIEDEDCHTVIENFLTRKLRKTGKKIHTGRSRNDQVLTAIRLYMKDQLKVIKKEAKKLAKHFLEFASQNQNIPLPGYTHTKQAMLSSVGHYFCAYFESLIDDIDFLNSIYQQIDKNPLGSAAGYGVSLLLDREFTTEELGFKKIQINSLYCQNSRGKFESIYLEGLAQIMLTLGRFANDILLFTSHEFDFFKVKNNLVTGSSIMPQKRNLDGLEILRGKVQIVITNQKLVKDLCKNLISGYHRDLQLIKKPLIESSEIVMESLMIADLYLSGITANEKSITAKISQGIYEADLAIELVQKKGIPFRTAYKKAHQKIKKYKPDPKENIRSKISLGGPGNLDIYYYKNRLKRL